MPISFKSFPASPACSLIAIISRLFHSDDGWGVSRYGFLPGKREEVWCDRTAFSLPKRGELSQTIRDEDDLYKHLDYIHYNQVKYGLVCFPYLWAYSSFDKWLEAGKFCNFYACSGFLSKRIQFVSIQLCLETPLELEVP